MTQSDSRLTKHTLFLVRGDFAKLSERFQAQGASKMIRVIVHNFISDLENTDKPIDYKKLKKIEDVDL